MIIVRFELHSAVTRQVTELARMEIVNDGTGSTSLRHYDVRTLKGRSTQALNRGVTQRECKIRDWPSERLHVWNLVTEALTRMGYGRKAKEENQGELL